MNKRVFEEIIADLEPISAVERLAALSDPNGELAERIRRYDENLAEIVRLSSTPKLRWDDEGRDA